MLAGLLPYVFRIRLVDEAPWLFLFDLEALWGVSKRIDWKPLPNDFINVLDIQGKA